MIEIMQYLKHFEIQETVTLVVVFKNANFSTKNVSKFICQQKSYINL